MFGMDADDVRRLDDDHFLRELEAARMASLSQRRDGHGRGDGPIEYRPWAGQAYALTKDGLVPKLVPFPKLIPKQRVLLEISDDEVSFGREPANIDMIFTIKYSAGAYRCSFTFF